MTAPRRRRGFTLLELIISMTIVLLAVALAGAGFAGQNQALQAMDLTRIANAASRDAVLNLEGTLRTAGWGIDPRYAIDLSSAYPSVDRIAAPDDLTFLSRNPLYQWTAQGEGACVTLGGCFAVGGNAWPLGSAVSGTPPSWDVTLEVGQVIERGRLVMLSCLGGESPVILRVATRHVGTGAAETIDTENTAAFPYNYSGGLLPCHSQAGAAMFLVDRYHYFVSGGWLMLDTGLDLDADGSLPPADTGDLIPVAENVDDFQVAYLLTGAGAGPTANDLDWVIGNDATAAELPVAPANATSLPLYTTPLNDGSRTTTASANVRGIRASLVLRSARIDQNQPASWTGDARPAVENRPGAAAADKKRRFLSSTEITLRNMESVRNFTF